MRNQIASAANGAGSVRVCMLISSFRPVMGGAERVTERLCKELIKQGVDVVVLTRRYRGLARSEAISGIPVFRLGRSSRTKSGSLSFAIHSLWLLATRFRDYGTVHVQNMDAPLLIGFAAKVLLGRRLIATLQSDPTVLLGPSRRTGPMRLRLMRRLVDTVGAQSSEMVAKLVAGGVPRSRIRVLPNSVDTGLFRPPSAAERQAARAHLGLNEAQTVYLFAGRLVALKRVDLLLQAWAHQNPEGSCALLVLGRGPELEALKTLASKLKLTNVRFEPATDDVTDYLHAADVFVLPSQREGLSNALLEAMAAGLAVIASDLPANQVLVRHGKTGLTFPVDDLSALTERLAKIESKELRRRLGLNAVRLARHFSIQATAEIHRRLYADH